MHQLNVEVKVTVKAESERDRPSFDHTTAFSLRSIIQFKNLNHNIFLNQFTYDTCHKKAMTSMNSTLAGYRLIYKGAII